MNYGLLVTYVFTTHGPHGSACATTSQALDFGTAREADFAAKQFVAAKGYHVTKLYPANQGDFG